MGNIYTYSIDINTLEVETHEDSGEDFDNYPDAGYADFNADGWECVYAESIVSADDAKRLVLEKCQQLSNIFNMCAKKVRGEKF